MISLQSVRLVTLQFSFSNRNVVPAAVQRRNQETPFEHVARKLRTAGKRLIEPTENCSLADFLGELEAAGYELVDTFCQERVDGERLDRTHPTVRFLFASREFAVPSKEFKQVRDVIRTELQGMLRSAFWRVRVFLNPFYQNGEEVAGQKAVSINLEARVPRYQSNGWPVLSRRKDENGKKVGDPKPLQSDFRLAVMGDVIRLLASD